MKRALSRAVSTALILAVGGATAPAMAQQSAPPAEQSAPAAQNSTLPPVELPDSPGSVNANPETSAPPPSASSSTPQNDNSKQPSGTAAAPAVQVTGSAASKPAGVAIAPPKQRQIRSWLIRFGFIAGAGAALGTVAALSAASPGRVPGSH